MVEFAHVICPVDFSESRRALAYAMAVVRWYEAELTILHVVPTFEAMQVRGDLGQPIQLVTPPTRDEVLEEMRRALGTLPPRATPVAEAGMGAEGHGGIGHAIFGSTTQQVVRGAPCPVLTVRGTPPQP